MIAMLFGSDGMVREFMLQDQFVPPYIMIPREPGRSVIASYDSQLYDVPVAPKHREFRVRTRGPSLVTYSEVVE